MLHIRLYFHYDIIPGMYIYMVEQLHSLLQITLYAFIYSIITLPHKNKIPNLSAVASFFCGMRKCLDDVISPFLSPPFTPSFPSVSTKSLKWPTPAKYPTLVLVRGTSEVGGANGTGVAWWSSKNGESTYIVNFHS